MPLNFAGLTKGSHSRELGILVSCVHLASKHYPIRLNLSSDQLFNHGIVFFFHNKTALAVKTIKYVVLSRLVIPFSKTGECCFMYTLTLQLKLCNR